MTMGKDHQAMILEAMTLPGFYPHPVESIERRETHISTVFLTGPFVYKIKKPVDLGFLDFSSLEKRQHYCRQEVALNRRLVRHFETGAEIITDTGYEDSIRQALEKTYKDDLSTIPHEVSVTAGFPWEEILRWAKKIDTDLIVLGPHSTRAQEKGVVRVAGRVGSTVENVVTCETCPVMVANQPAGKNRLRFQRVLVAVDFSRSCECAVSFAAKLATHYHSRLSVFHMIPVPPIPKYTRTNYTADAALVRKRLGSFYTTYLDKTDHQYLIQAGAMPHLEILSCADKNNVDLIIMGSHTKEKPGKWYPGSAVERAAYRADCPVMVVTDPGVLAHWDNTIATDDGVAKDRLINVFTETQHNSNVTK